MIDVSLFGWLLGTLTSTLSLVLLFVALTSAAVVAGTALEAALGAHGVATRRLSPGGAPAVRGARLVGIAAAAGALVAALLGLRVGAGEGDLVPSLAIGLAGAAALGASAACAFALGARGVAALAAARTQRDAASLLAGEARRLLLDAERGAYAEGRDLLAEVEDADAAVERLRCAVALLAATETALQAKIDEPATMASGDAAALAEDLVGARDDAALKLEMGRRVLTAAEAAGLRIALNLPLRRLLRRRPRAATQAIAAGAERNEAALRAAGSSVEAFLREVRAARAEVVEIARSRGEAPPDGAEPAEDGPAGAALRELAAMEDAYGALLGRLRVALLRMSARSGAEQIESAAGALSDAARAAAIEPEALAALVTEVARADAAVAVAAPDAGGSRALAEALAAGADALERSDAASLSDLIAALREMR